MPQDRYLYFRIEARELLDALSQGALALERGVDGDELKRLLRQAHTLKGAARVVDHGDIAEAAHALEERLQALQAQTAPASRAQVDGLLALIDAMDVALGAIGAPAAPEQADSAPAPAPVSAPAAAEEGFETVRVALSDLEALLAGVNEATIQLDGLQRRLGGLALRDDDLAARLDRTRTELAAVRERTHRVRLVPAQAVFGQLERAVRNAANQVGKQVHFEATGGHTRLDGHVLLELRDALLHLVRNAVDHGIEPPVERQRAGKPPEGRVSVHVERRGDRVAFVTRDDGRGLDVSAVRAAAVARGLLSAEEAEKLSPEAASELVLGSGFSTRGVVTELSGRGLGLDIVNDVVTRLKGELTLDGVPGEGLAVTALVPLSLLSLKALLVEAGGIVGAIPLDAIVTTARVAPEAIVRQGDREALLVDEMLVPFWPLAARSENDASNWSVVVVRASAGQAAIGVDRILEVADAVVRPLPKAVGTLPLVVGASLDAEGAPRPVYDALGLVSAARSSQAPKAAPAPRARRILVVDDSLTTRMLEQSILESAGYVVELAASGEEGLAKARADRYDLMIVDVEMPGMSGFEVVRATREDPVLRDVPAVLLTSRASPSDLRRGAEAGARAYLVKGDFEQGRFLQTIRGLVGP